jgi:hypothetical protein
MVLISLRGAQLRREPRKVVGTAGWIRVREDFGGERRCQAELPLDGVQEREERSSLEDERVWLRYRAERLELALRPTDIANVEAQVRSAQRHEAFGSRVDRSRPTQPACGRVYPCVATERATVQHVDDGSGHIQRNRVRGRPFGCQPPVCQRTPVPPSHDCVMGGAGLGGGEQREHRRGRDNIGGDTVESSGRDVVARKHSVQPTLSEELPEQGPVTAGASQFLGFERHAASGVPRGSAALQLGGKRRIALSQAGA